MDAFTRRELYLRPGRNGVGSAVAVDSHVGFFANGLVGQAVVDADEDIAAAVDDVLGLDVYKRQDPDTPNRSILGREPRVLQRTEANRF